MSTFGYFDTREIVVKKILTLFSKVFEGRFGYFGFIELICSTSIGTTATDKVFKSTV